MCQRCTPVSCASSMHAVLSRAVLVKPAGPCEAAHFPWAAILLGERRGLCQVGISLKTDKAVRLFIWPLEHGGRVLNNRGE